MFIGIAIIVAVTGIGGIVLVMASAVDNIIMDGMAWGEQQQAESRNITLGDNASAIIHVREVIE